jgi:ankyrin repeat protein/mRNA-degrading endonuclease RelE of RelBE toxin-antitoxin system
MSFKHILPACIVFITHTSFAMHGKNQIAIQKKRMQKSLQKKQLQTNCNIKLLRLCNSDMTNADISLQYKLCNDVKTLLDDGADINAETESKYTSLYFACLNKNSHLVKLLIAYGADVNARIQKGFASLHIAAENGSVDIVNMLAIAQANVNIQSFVGQQTALHLSSCGGRYNVVKNLLEHKANPNIQKANGATPLYIATEKGFINIVRLLFVFHADPDIPHVYGYTPLHVACEMNNPEILEILLTNNANPNATSKKQLTTPLRIACALGNPNSVHLLLNAQADINAEDKYKYTPLHGAVFYDHLEIVEILLEKGANVHAQSIHHETPMHLAYCKKNPVMIDLLHKYGAPKISDEQAQTDKEEFFEQINQQKEPVIPPTENSSTQSAKITTKSPTISTTTKQTIKPSSSVNTNNQYQLLQDKNFKWPKFLTKSQQYATKDQLRELKYWPKVTDLDIKPLQGAKKGAYRLREGSCRVIFFVDTKEKNIFIEEIGPRKNIYKKTKLI